MKNQKNCLDVKQFLEWREQLYLALDSRRETIIELIDSLSSNSQASSVVELSLNPLFRRDYNSLYKGIKEFLPEQTDDKYSEQVNCLLDAVCLTIPKPKSRSFNLLGIDTTPYPRPYSATLAEKTFIHYPNPIKGNKPISIGHTYSVVSALPDRCETGHVPWAIPLSGERIPASDKFANIGNKQLKKIFKSSEFAGDYLSVLVADSLYRSARIYWGTSQTKKLSYYYTSEK